MQAASQDQDRVQKKKKEDNARIWHNLKILIPRSYLGPIAHAQRVLDRIYIFFGNGCLTGTLNRAVARAAIITLVVWFHFRYFPLSCTSQRGLHSHDLQWMARKPSFHFRALLSRSLNRSFKRLPV